MDKIIPVKIDFQFQHHSGLLPPAEPAPAGDEHRSLKRKQDEMLDSQVRVE